jgi:tRNA(Ile)-lysidine synthase
MTFLESIRTFIAEHRLLGAGDVVCVGYSGGPDSTALALVLIELHKRGEISGLGLAHLDHGIRKGSADDVKSCAQFAKRRKLEFITERVDVPAYAKEHGVSLETAAREVRYDFFARSAKKLGANKIATGHSLNDQAETVLFRILRGTGITGLAGIQPVRSLLRFEPEGLKLVRPLLCVSREEIEKYCRGRSAKTLTDPSNQDVKHKRNHIRNVVMPFIEKHFPHVTESLTDLAGTAETMRKSIELMAANFWPEIVIESSRARVRFNRARLLELEPPVTREMFLRAMHVLDVGEKDYTADHYHRLEQALRIGKTKERDFPGRMRLKVDKKEFTLSRAPSKETKLKKPEPVGLPVPGFALFGDEPVRISTQLLETMENIRPASLRGAGRWTEYIPAKLAVDLVVRSRRIGDRFHPLGAPGSKKLSDFFTDQKVPRAIRDTIPLVVQGDTILWVVGYRLGEEARVRPGTKSVVFLRAEPGAWA